MEITRKYIINSFKFCFRNLVVETNVFETKIVSNGQCLKNIGMLNCISKAELSMHHLLI